MPRFFTIDRANDRIPDVRDLLLLLRSQRDELVELRDRYVALTGGTPGADGNAGTAGSAGTAGNAGAAGNAGTTGSAGTAGSAGADGNAGAAGNAGTEARPGGEAAPDVAGTQPDPSLAALEQARLVSLRIKGIVDQMGASVARIDGWGITLRDIETGLIDFPALVNGRQVWLCWQLGEEDVEWWHELDTGLSGRQPLGELY